MYNTTDDPIGLAIKDHNLPVFKMLTYKFTSQYLNKDKHKTKNKDKNKHQDKDNDDDVDDYGDYDYDYDYDINNIRIGKDSTFSALFEAIVHDDASIVEYILETNPCVRFKNIDVNYLATDGVSKWSDTDRPLLVACFNGNIKILKLLLEYPKFTVDHVNTRSQTTQQTALHTACAQDRSEIASILLNDERTDVNLAAKYMDTPLMKAIECEKEKYALMMLEHKKINVNLKDNMDKTALTYAKNSNMKAVQDAIEKKLRQSKKKNVF